jgi:hypothetical protein
MLALVVAPALAAALETAQGALLVLLHSWQGMLLARLQTGCSMERPIVALMKGLLAAGHAEWSQASWLLCVWAALLLGPADRSHQLRASWSCCCHRCQTLPAERQPGVAVGPPGQIDAMPAPGPAPGPAAHMVVMSANVEGCWQADLQLTCMD